MGKKHASQYANFGSLLESTLLIDAAYRANFDLPQIPEPDGSYVLNLNL